MDLTKITLGELGNVITAIIGFFTIIGSIVGAIVSAIKVMKTKVIEIEKNLDKKYKAYIDEQAVFFSSKIIDTIIENIKDKGKMTIEEHELLEALYNWYHDHGGNDGVPAKIKSVKEAYWRPMEDSK